MPRFRFTIRRMMIVVTIVGSFTAFYFGPGLLHKRWQYAEAAGNYRFYADRYDDYGEGLQAYSSCYGRKWDDLSETVRIDIGEHHKDKAYRTVKASHYRRLSAKYQQAALQPWRSLAADPPEPK